MKLTKRQKAARAALQNTVYKDLRDPNTLDMFADQLEQQCDHSNADPSANAAAPKPSATKSDAPKPQTSCRNAAATEPRK